MGNLKTRLSNDFAMLADSYARPIFIVSSERSGSNLLRTLLGNHSNICCPRAPHLLKTFSRLHHLYWPGSNTENSIALLDDMISVANFELFDWQLTMSGQEIFERHRPSNLVSCFHAIYATYAQEVETNNFVCKENNLFDFVCQLERFYDSPKFIYLYRDPRDYVASWLKVPMLFKTPFHAAQNWAQEQSICLREFRGFGLPAHFVSYENLISDTPTTMAEILSFVGETVDERCFHVDSEKNKDQAGNPFLKNLSQQVDSRNQKKYRKQLSPSEIEVIETLTKREMVQLGYELESAANWKSSNIFRIENRIRKFWLSRKLAKAHPDIVQSQRRRLALLRKIETQRCKHE